MIDKLIKFLFLSLTLVYVRSLESRSSLPDSSVELLSGNLLNIYRTPKVIFCEVKDHPFSENQSSSLFVSYDNDTFVRKDGLFELGDVGPALITSYLSDPKFSPFEACSHHRSQRSAMLDVNLHFLSKIGYGRYFYTVGDGILGAVKSDEPTNELLYSLNNGTSWHSDTFFSSPMRVLWFLTDPEDSTNILIVGLIESEFRTVPVDLKIPFGPIDFDHKAPPRDLNVSKDPSDPEIRLLTWKSGCPSLLSDVGYLVSTTDLIKNRTVETMVQSLSLNISINWGGRYSFTVRSNENGSRLSPPLYFDAPGLPVPYQLSAIPKENESYFVYWKTNDLPTGMAKKGMSFEVMVSSSKNFTSPDIKQSFGNSITLQPLKEGEPMFVKVKMVDSEGYESAYSESVEIPFDGNSSSMAIGIIAAVFIVLVLAGGMAFLIRNKFVNGHYITRTKSATFTNGDLLDDDGLLTHSDHGTLVAC